MRASATRGHVAHGPNHPGFAWLNPGYEGSGSFLPSAGFAAAAQFPATHPVLRVAIDLDGDGFTDLGSVNSGGSTVDVLLNNGNGTFTTTAYTVGSQPVAMSACDVDGDNLRDLVVANSGSNSLSILVNRCDGTFAPATSVATGSMPISLTCAANLSTPLRHNLHVVNSGDGTYMHFQDDGAGNFALKVTVAVGSGPRQVLTSDLDFDLLRDAVTVNSASDSVPVLKQGSNFAYTRADYPVGARR